LPAVKPFPIARVAGNGIDQGLAFMNFQPVPWPLVGRIQRESFLTTPWTAFTNQSITSSRPAGRADI